MVHPARGFFFLCLFLLCALPLVSLPAPLEPQGFSLTEPVVLAGPWDFWPGQWIQPWQTTRTAAQAGAITLPAAWNALSWQGKPAGTADGFGTFRMVLQLPHTPEPWALGFKLAGSAVRIWWRGALVADIGRIADNPLAESAANRPGIYLLGAGGPGELLVQISNHHHVDGGLWSKMEVAPLSVLQSHMDRRAAADWFFAGAFILFGLLALGLMVIMPQSRAALWFGLMALDLGVRILVHGNLNVYLIWKDFDWDWFNRIRHLTMYLGPVFFFGFLHTILPGRIRSLVLRTVAATSIVGILCTFLFPYRIYGDFLYAFFVVIILEIGYLLVLLVRAFRDRDPSVRASFAGLMVFVLSCGYDFARVVFFWPVPEALPLGTFMLIFFLSFALGYHLLMGFREKERLSEELSSVNKSMHRFFPREFLSCLEKESFTQVELGHNARMDMAVLFADLRNFTSITQNMTPEQIFRLINSFMGEMGPIIRSHGGFIDKYLGDGIMALFPSGGEAALDAAVQMQVALGNLNKRLGAVETSPPAVSQSGALGGAQTADLPLDIEELEELEGFGSIPELEFGVGIHQGSLLLGTIGESERMDSTVISSVVNLASRLESLSKEYRARIIVSPQVVMNLSPGSTHEYRFLGFEQVKGFANPQPIYEVFSADPPHIRSQKLKSRAEFEDALVVLGRHEYDSAARMFLDLRRRHPEDASLDCYLNRIRTIKERQLLYRIQKKRRLERGA